MRKQTLRTIAVVTLVIIFAVVWARRPWQADAPAPDPQQSAQPEPVVDDSAADATEPAVVATINGVAITPDMLDREVKISRFNVSAPLPPLTGDALAAAREEALNQLIDRQLVLQAAAQQGFALGEAEVQQRVDLLYGTHSTAEIDNALAQIQATRADLNWWVGEIFTVEEFTLDVILADAPPEQRQAAYNEWFNQRRAEATLEFADSDSTGTAGAPLYALPGEPAPAFTLTTPGGQPISLADYRGQVVLLNFWATWCPSCVTEMPAYEQVYQELQPDFVVLGVNLQENGDHVQRYAAGLGVTFPLLLDADGSVTSRQYRVAGMPGSLLIDRSGVIRYRHTGPLSEETLRQKLAELGL